ncbi:DUF3274 domain-containing protein [Pseudomonas sp.]|uniref:T6SS effector phospholipase Tle3 domain-containing protein n=1 Tax=Pseudomonas sp. TaxID=306 RepID=UPI00262A80CD|nr:DUF3274 domain-containing protein [Pseudomonas sp.]
MSDPNYSVIAEQRSRLVPNRPGDRRVAIPRDMPGIVIFLHGVNDPGASYESVETGLLQGLNERLNRPDLCAGRYGAEFAAAKAVPVKDLNSTERNRLDDPDTHLYKRSTDKNTRSCFIPFYWGYRAAPDEIKRDKNGDPTKLRTQYQDNFNNRLDRHFAKGGGFFANATNNLLEMFGEGFDTLTRHLANLALPNTLFMGANPHRRYFILAAHRLAMLVSEARRLAPDETITIMGHSQGTLITLLAQALLVDRGQRCADCAIMVASPYSLLPSKTPEGSDTLGTLIDIVRAVTATPHAMPSLSELQYGQPAYGGRTGPHWSPQQGQRLGPDENTVVFPERDNRGKVYLYFSHDDSTVGINDVSGIGTFGVPSHLPDGKPVMSAMPSGFYQRLWSTRHRNEKPIYVGTDPSLVPLRVMGDRYSAEHQLIPAILQNTTGIGETRYINAEPLTPPYAPQMFGGEAITGSPTRAGIDAPDAVSQNNALGNSNATFKWVELRHSPARVSEAKALAAWNQGKGADDQTRVLRQTVVLGNPMLDIADHFLIEREETPNEIRARLAVDPKEWGNNSYHSAVLRSPENHRWVTAMDVAVGQAKCLDDPQIREVLIAIADWRMDEDSFLKLNDKPGWPRLSAEARALVRANYLYYEDGVFPPEELVPMTPPPLVRRPCDTEGKP